jgi:hypothetical protein
VTFKFMAVKGVGPLLVVTSCSTCSYDHYARICSLTGMESASGPGTVMAN